MYLYVAPDKFNDPETITERRVRNIRAVELFSPHENAPETDHLFLPAIEKHTVANFDQTDNPASPQNWKLFEVNENGDETLLLNFLLRLRLAAFVRYPLLGARLKVRIPTHVNEKLVSREIAYQGNIEFSRNYQFRFGFEFNNTTNPNDKWNYFKGYETYNGDNLSSPGYSFEWQRSGGSGGAVDKFPISSSRGISWAFEKDDELESQLDNCLNVFERNPPKLLH
jgi:hypothetical protein